MIPESGGSYEAVDRSTWATGKKLEEGGAPLAPRLTSRVQYYDVIRNKLYSSPPDLTRLKRGTGWVTTRR